MYVYEKIMFVLKMFCLVDRQTHHLHRDKLEIKCWMLERPQNNLEHRWLIGNARITT